MSLRRFHLCFLGFVVFFCAAFGAWCLLSAALPPMFLWMGWMSLALGAATLVYALRFWKKTRHDHS